MSTLNRLKLIALSITIVAITAITAHALDFKVEQKTNNDILKINSLLQD